jgi:ATP-dependent Clp protease ATP-binding subunit ClpA
MRAVYESSAILYVRGLFEARDAIQELPKYLRSAGRSMIATGTPLSFRLTLERDEELARNVEPVSVSASSEVETAEIVQAKKEKFEMFHGIVLSAEAVETAISVSGRFLRNRTLPDRVLDLIDRPEPY